MRTKYFALILFFCVSSHLSLLGQPTSLNLNFEIISNQLPSKWYSHNNEEFRTNIDSLNVLSGKYSVCLESFSDQKYGGLAIKLPSNINGKSLTFSGFIKSKGDPTNYISPYVSIDPSVSYRSFYFTSSGDGEKWEPFEVKIDLTPNKTDGIELGIFFKGKGKIWLDNFNVLVDDKDTINFTEFRNYPARQDTLFNSGSLISEIKLSKSNLENIKFLGLVWGFVKYYHPNVAKGDFNFDYQLFRILSIILDVESSKKRDELILNWLKSLGEFDTEILTDFNIQKDTKHLPDLFWIDYENISPALKEYLLKVKCAKRINEHYYFDFHPWLGNPVFYNENSYSNMNYPDTGYRILTLFRYWNIIQYFFPYKKNIGENWQKTLKEFIPKFVNSSNEQEYCLTTLELICKIKDSHATIWDSDNSIKTFLGERMAPIRISQIENRAVITGFYKQGTNLSPLFRQGDVVLKVNGIKIKKLTKERLKYTPSSNETTQMRDVYRNILRTNNKTIKIVYLQNNSRKEAQIDTYNFDDFNIHEEDLNIDSTIKILPNNILYLQNSTIRSEALGYIWGQLKSSKGVIIDMRNYPKYDHFWGLSNYLFTNPTKFVRFTKNSFLYPGLLNFDEGYEIGQKCDSCYKGRVVILINEKTQSSSEFQTMGYRALPNSILIGTSTAGADGDLTTITLPGYIVTAMSGNGVYYPDGKDTQRIGIIPDIIVRPTIDGIKKHSDELLEAAIKYLNK